MSVYESVDRKLKRNLARRLYMETKRFMLETGSEPQARSVSVIAAILTKWLRKRKVSLPKAELEDYVAMCLPRMVKKVKKGIRKGALQQKKEHPYDTEDQDEHFFYIAGVTSGGTPYGLPWHDALDMLEVDSDPDPELPFDL